MNQENQNKRKELPHVMDDVPANVTLALFFDKPLPIDGGWGYGKDDAVVITTSNPAEGVGLEYEFVELRSRLASYELGCMFESFVPLLQSLNVIDDVNYDIIEAEVTLIDDNDNVTKYHTKCWFNVDKLFETYNQINNDK